MKKYLHTNIIPGKLQWIVSFLVQLQAETFFVADADITDKTGQKQSGTGVL